MLNEHGSYITQEEAHIEDRVKRMMLGLTYDVRSHLYATQTLPSVHFSQYEWEMVLKYWPSVYLLGNKEFIQKQKITWLDFILMRKKSPIKIRLKLSEDQVAHIRDEWTNTNTVLIDGYKIKVDVYEDGRESRV